jgi:hypothetical protein
VKLEVTAALEALQREDGTLRAPEVVEAAREPVSVLHGFFEWDDDAAAAAHRLAQARRLIGQYKVHVVAATPTGDQRALLVRGFVSDRNTGGSLPPGTYHPVTSLTPMQRQVLLLRMQREIDAMRLRYGDLEEFWAAVENLRAKRGAGSAAASG